MGQADEPKNDADTAHDSLARQLTSHFLPAMVVLLTAAGLLIWLGPTWGTFFGVIAALAVVSALKSVFEKSSWREDEPDTAGEAECPHCGSLQTDVVERYDDKGREYRQRVCFACDEPIGERSYDL